MEPTYPTEHEQPNLSPNQDQNKPEKVIQPIHTIQVAESPTNVAVAAHEAQNAYPAVSTGAVYDPSVAQPGYGMPAEHGGTRNYESGPAKRVAMQHRSLMLLAIWGLFSAAYTFCVALIAQHTLQDMKTNSTVDADIQGIQIQIVTAFVIVAVVLAINAYFLFARNRDTVMLVLKIMIFLQIVSVFGMFFGIAPSTGLAFWFKGAYLILLALVYYSVKTHPAM